MDASTGKDRYFVLKTKLEKLSIPEHWSMVGEIDTRFVFEENCPYNDGKPPVLGVDENSFIALGNVDDELRSNFDCRGRVNEALDNYVDTESAVQETSYLVLKSESDDDDEDMGYLFSSETQESETPVEIAEIEEVVLTCNVVSDTADVVLETTDDLLTTSTALNTEAEAQIHQDSFSSSGEDGSTINRPVEDDECVSNRITEIPHAERTTPRCTLNSHSISSVLENFQEHQCDLCHRRQSSLTGLAIHYASVHSVFKTVVKTDNGLKLEDSEPSKTEFRVRRMPSGEDMEGDEEIPERTPGRSKKRGKSKAKRTSPKSTEGRELIQAADGLESQNSDNASSAEGTAGKRPRKKVSEPKPDFFQCHLCEKKYTGKQNLRRHIISKHEGKRPYLCELCGKSFALRPSWAIHMRVHAGYKKPKPSVVEKRQDFVCEICGEKRSSKWNLDYHRRIHSGEKPHECQECGKRFRAAPKLAQHVATIHVPTDQRYHACQHCDRRYALARMLNEHVRNEHSAEPNFNCKDCEQSFAKRSLLDRHRANDHGPKASKCHICGKTYSSASYLRKHLLSHAGKNPHVCNECGKSFNYRNSLKSHILTHTGEKPFACDICDKRFTTSSSVTVHRRTHTGEKPYKCPHCSQGFALPDTLRRHVSRRH